MKIEQVTSFLELQELASSGYKSLLASRNLPPNFILSKFEIAETKPLPTRFTLQKGENQHIEFRPIYLRYLNHSCHPNVFVDTVNRQLITLRNINKGEEIAFFYPSTEWEMEEPFDCLCGNSNCLKKIRGAAYLSFEDLKKYKVSDFVVEKHSLLVTAKNGK